MRTTGFVSLCLALGTLWNCTSVHNRCSRVSEPTMRHEVIVPQEHRAGRQWFYGSSNHEMYVREYEEGWFSCVERYAENIDYETSDSDLITSGWPSETEGFRSGYLDALRKIEWNIERFGRESTRSYLQRILEGS